MSEQEPLSGIVAALTVVSDQVNRTESWITPISVELADVDAAEAAWKPAPEERSIWEITSHVYEWTQWVVHFLRGQDINVIDWPPVPDTSEAAWDQTRRNLREVLTAFHEAISNAAPEILLSLPTPAETQTNGITGILSILVHNAYHAGQITKLRERYRATLTSPSSAGAG